jgi:hypothetical protein
MLAIMVNQRAARQQIFQEAAVGHFRRVGGLTGHPMRIGAIAKAALVLLHLEHESRS